MDPGLKQTLDRLYDEYDFRGRVLHDPIEFPHRYKKPEDIEVAGFIAACLAYGKVDLFKPVISRILSVMGENPAGFVRDFNLKKNSALFKGLKYRFNSNEDILCLLFVLSKTLRKYGSLKAVFNVHFGDDDTNIGPGLAGLIAALTKIDTSPVYGEDLKPSGFLQFIPSPLKGSACKRMNLFLRWMIRDRDIDFGIWKGVPKNKLVIPLDTHIARISKCLGFTMRSAQDWKMAVEITESLKRFDAEDPLKYDFALCHQGIAGLCSRMKCDSCTLKPHGAG